MYEPGRRLSQYILFRDAAISKFLNMISDRILPQKMLSSDIEVEEFRISCVRYRINKIKITEFFVVRQCLSLY